MRITAATEQMVDLQSQVAAARDKGRAGQPGSADPQGPSGAAQEAVDRQSLDRITERMNTAAEVFQTTVQFEVVYGTRVIIKVVDRATGEVLSEFPPERLVQAFREMREMIGLLVDEKV
ncbi:flagellar protein FlaG [Symbiobacterium thermophilum]|uniref:Flagellar protein FlaG n=1 Tax=Symbiobacterium thermophilum TaxID=2734 RepID=A0A953ICF2_SYMTR|nr:flagellar protein FlaG [Symbiobacterium thermophilum]MBY6275650.1 hypothetical protein [Symbiobacterium thermophilum]